MHNPQVACERLIIERLTKSVFSGDSESPATDTEVDHDAGTFDSCHLTNSDHGQGAVASSWRVGSGQDLIGAFVPLA